MENETSPHGWQRSESGQATVEYLLVGLALIAMIVALGVLWHCISNGDLASLVETHASHALNRAGGLADALMF